MRSSAQGLFMMMTNGFGATIGTQAAKLIVNHFVYDAADATAMETWGHWQTCWFIFAAYSLVVAILFWIFFPKTPVEKKA